MILAIVQARAGSNRMPGKVLADIAGAPMLTRVVERAQRSRTVDEVIVATSDSPQDDAVEATCRRMGVGCFRGSEADVLDRFYRAATAYGATAVVRLTADCPLLDPSLLDEVVRRFLRGECDYASNSIRPTLPDGLDVEVISAAALERTWREATSTVDREHVTSYVRASGTFRVCSVEHPDGRNLDRLRWTVDEEHDLAFVREVYRKAGDRALDGLEDVLRVIEDSPELSEWSSEATRNEGYYRSVAELPLSTPPKRSLTRSLELKRRAGQLIPSLSQTFSKGPSQFPQGVSPVYLQRASGSRVEDVDGNVYVDYIMALGSVILGHAYPRVDERVRQQLATGVAFSLPHPLEVELAELLVDVVPCAEKVRFAKNGSDATSGAVRAARAITGRDQIACCGYHGWQDWFIGTTSRDRGVPRAVAELTRPFAYNDLESLERILHECRGQIAAVILEPTGVVEPDPGFLEGVAELTRGSGAILIFDEIVTGFRLALGGAQERFGVVPDMACFGKAMGNGYAVAAVTGLAELMEVFDEIFFSFTFAGEPASLAAAVETIHELRDTNALEVIASRGLRLMDGYNLLAREFGLHEHTWCNGYPVRSVISFRDSDGRESLLLKSLFQQEVLRRGILSAGYHNLAYAHDETDIELTLHAYRDAFDVMRAALDSGDPLTFLEGELVQPVFRQL